MSEPAPGSREALFALLAGMVRSGQASPERASAARVAIGAGLLGEPSEAFVTDDAGRARSILVWAASVADEAMVRMLLDAGVPVDAGAGTEGTALHAALRIGDAALVELLLARGASPLAMTGAGESALRAAHAGPDRASFDRVRGAAREASEALGGGPTLSTSSHERRYVLRPSQGRVDRGAEDLRRQGGSFDVLLLECDLKVAAKELAARVVSPRRESDAAGRAIADAARLLVLYQIVGVDWTVLPLSLAEDSPWSIRSVPELEAAGAGVEPLIRALTRGTESRAIHLRPDGFAVHAPSGAVERRTFALEADWAPSYEPMPTPAEAAALLPDFEGDATELLVRAAREREQQRRWLEMDEALADLGVLAPPMTLTSDGAHLQLSVAGLGPEDIERVDVVVLQEFGEPAVDRTIAAPRAPAQVGPPGQPALAPPPLVALSAPPPMVSETPVMPNNPPPPSAGPPGAPPLVGEPAPSKAPPPLVTEAAAAPPPVSPAPAREASEAAPAPAAPPRLDGPANPSAPPPLVAQPPEAAPMVVESSDEPPPPEPPPATGAAGPSAPPPMVKPPEE